MSVHKNQFLVAVSAFAFVSVSSAFAGGPFPKSTPELLEKGKAVFAVNCVACHGEKGDGTGVAAVALNPKPRNFSKEKFKNGDKPQQIFDTVTKGLVGTAMAPFGHLSVEDRQALTHYVLLLKKAGK